MKKSNKILNKILSMFFVVILLCSCFNVSAFAAEGVYGEVPPQNIIDIPTGTGRDNRLINVPYTNQNADTVVFLMDYVQYLYSYNMTNGQKPFLIVFTATSVNVYCVPVSVGDVYVNSVNKTSWSDRIVFNITRDDVFGNQSYQSWELLDFGNFQISSLVSSTATIPVYWNTPSKDHVSYIYLNSDGSYSYYAYNSETTGVYAPLVDMYLDMKTFINDSYSSVSVPGIPGEEEGVVLDIGSIITAVMTAPMIVFGGLTGTPGDLSQSLNLFGVDIRAAIISILVIAIVVFIIKFLRGG